MSDEERELYEALFPYENDPFHIVYGYFSVGSLRTLAMLKAKIRNSFIDPIIIEDDVHEGSFFVKIQQKDVDTFLSIVRLFKYKEKKIPKKCINKIYALFGDKTYGVVA